MREKAKTTRETVDAKTPSIIGRLLTAFRAWFAMPSELREVRRELRTATTAANQTAKKHYREATKKHQNETDSLRRQIAALGGRLLQHQLQLGHLATLVNAGEGSLPLGRRVPTGVAPAPVSEDSSTASDRAAGATDEWLELPACPACGAAERTVVCEWNKLVLLDTTPDERAILEDAATRGRTTAEV